jgi:hypothetical protein
VVDGAAKANHNQKTQSLLLDQGVAAHGPLLLQYEYFALTVSVLALAAARAYASGQEDLRGSASRGAPAKLP